MITERKAEQIVREIQRYWPACQGVREVNGRYEVSFFNSMGGLHWINVRIAPAVAESTIEALMDDSPKVPSRNPKRRLETLFG